MVKNELSIRAQQVYNVASKLASNAINKIKLQTTKNILNVNSKIPFKTSENEEKLYKASMNYLKDNVDSLFFKNMYSSQEKYLDNIRKYKKLEWSLYKIDRTNPDKEQIRKIISQERQRSVARDNACEIATFNAKWYEKETREHIEYRLKYDSMLNEIYNGNASLYEQSYNEFYKKVCDKHAIMYENAKQTIDAFYPVIKNAIAVAHEAAFAKQHRDIIFDLSKQIVNSYKQLESLSIKIEEQNIDLQVLIEQTKEKLDVYQEKEELIAAMEANKQAKEEITANISKINEKLQQAYVDYETAKNVNVVIDYANCDDKQKEVLDYIVVSFKENAFEKAFDMAYVAIKNYVLTICPFFYSYLKAAEEKFDERNKQYRSQIIKTLPAEVAKVYSNENNYIKYLCNYNENADISELKNKHEVELARLKVQYDEKIQALKAAKEVRIKEYKEQKAAAKVNLKMADSVKAAEIKEVVKLYKKAINNSEHKRHRLAKNEYNKLVSLENKRFEREVLKETLPATLSFKLEYENSVEENKNQKAKEFTKLNKILRTDYRLSKYKKNSTSAKRENMLGYLFLSIWAIGFVAFTLIPIIYIILMCFNNITYTNEGYTPLFEFTFKDGFSFPSFVGVDNFETLFLSNYEFMFTQLPQFFRSLLFYVPIVVFIGFVLAMLLNTKIRGRTLFRIIYFLPVVIVSGPVLEMLNGSNTSGRSSIRLTLDGSSVAKILESISPKALTYANEVFQNFIIILWMTGVPIVLFISALQKINRQLYEAAEIDGANKWQMLWTITFPLIKSVLMIVCLFTIMQVTTINVAFVNPINDWLNRRMSDMTSNLGVVAVAAWCQTIVVLVFVLASFLLFREREFISKDKNFEEMEELKRKKQQRKAKIIEFFHINDIKAFFTKLFAPLNKALHNLKAKRKEKEEGGM